MSSFGAVIPLWAIRLVAATANAPANAMIVPLAVIAHTNHSLPAVVRTQTDPP